MKLMGHFGDELVVVVERVSLAHHPYILRRCEEKKRSISMGGDGDSSTRYA